MNSTAQAPSIGIDIGGTKICVGIVDANRNIVTRTTFPTEAKKGPEYLTEKIVRKVSELTAQNGVSHDGIRSIGCCIPGTVDPLSGFVALAPNIGWKDYDFGAKLGAAFQGVPIRYEQDTKAAAYGEYLLLGDVSIRNLFYVTVSTGIGAGVVIDGKVVRGSHFAAGEIGQCAIERQGTQCTCGNTGCLQAYSRGPAIVETIKNAMNLGKPCALKGQKPIESIDTWDVTNAALAGDELCRATLEKAADDVGYALSWVVNILDPDIIIVGGGVVKSGSFFFDRLEHATRKYSYPPLKDVTIKVSSHWEESNVIGVAVLSTMN